MKIGIDIGNVIIGGGGDDTQFFGDNFLNTPKVCGIDQSLQDLWAKGHEIHFISKCSEKTEIRTLEWFRVHSYLAPSFLIPRHRMHFVRKRPLKAPMAQALELDIFIDDRQDIIDSMEGIVKHPILFKSWDQTNRELKEIFLELT